MYSAPLIATILAGACLHVTSAHWILAGVGDNNGPISNESVWTTDDDDPATLTGEGLECGNMLTPPKASLAVQAGDNVTGQLMYTSSILAFKNAPEHIGCCAVYLQPQYDNNWYKIEEMGTDSCGVFCSQYITVDNSKYEVLIPKTIPNGNYKLRFENIAFQSSIPQIYGRCANITVTGGPGPNDGNLSNLGKGVDLNIKAYSYLKEVNIWELGVIVQNGSDPTTPACQTRIAKAFDKIGLPGPPVISGGTNYIKVGNNTYDNVTPLQGGGTNTTT